MLQAEKLNQTQSCICSSDKKKILLSVKLTGNLNTERPTGQSTRGKRSKVDRTKKGPDGGKDFTGRGKQRIGAMWKKNLSRDMFPFKPQ